MIIIKMTKIHTKKNLYLFIFNLLLKIYGKVMSCDIWQFILNIYDFI